MSLEVKKKLKETSLALASRFTKSMQQSGILLRARKSQFREREKSHQMKKRAAIRRSERKKEYQKLRKLGRVK